MTEQAQVDSVARRARIWSLLLDWYAEYGRDLPWRHTRDPYAVLVSEVMLQQTQVERVLPKYREFMARFPTLAALAAAPTSEVIRAWAPLGYNVRAVRLQQIARQAVEHYAGSLPSTLDGLLQLKGIGRYTAGAIACFAFGAPIATVDTNIRRVLWRVLRGIEPASWPAGQRAARDLLALAEWALPPHAAYDWQQALMDLGATICVSRQPRCECCPLATQCAALAATAHVALFPSGEALVRLRDAQKGASARATVETKVEAKVAETSMLYTPAPGRRRTAPPFTSTSRYFRGRVLAVLREGAPDATVTLGELGPRIKADWSDGDLPWMGRLVRGLARDGLVRLVDDTADDSIALGEGTHIALP